MIRLIRMKKCKEAHCACCACLGYRLLHSCWLHVQLCYESCWPRVYFSDLGNETMYGNISQSLV